MKNTESRHAVELMPGIQPVTYTHAQEQARTHAHTHKEQTQVSVYQFPKLKGAWEETLSGINSQAVAGSVRGQRPLPYFTLPTKGLSYHPVELDKMGAGE